MSALAQPHDARASLAGQTVGDRSEVDAAAAAAWSVLLAPVRPAAYSDRPHVASRRKRTNPGDSGQDLLDLPCRHDPALWFAENPADLERAKTLCAACPIRLPCLAVAVHRAEYAGVWGGHIFDRGQIIPHKRPRGRPRKRHEPRAVTAPSPPVREHNLPVNPTSTAEWTSQRRVDTAAARMYDAECALHAAHQSHLDAWINAAGQKLHDAVAEYLAAIATCGAPDAR